MRKSILSLLLALCYLSVSLSIFSLHFHDHGDRLSHSCPACAWHSESVSDEPVRLVFVSVPLILVETLAEAELQISSSHPRTLADRGPPLLS
jgi:hypothetical protein